jgi:hypothetical protein
MLADGANFSHVVMSVVFFSMARVGLWLNYGFTPAGEVLPGREVVEWMA